MKSVLHGRVVEAGDLAHDRSISGLVVEVGRKGFEACDRNLLFKDVVVRTAEDDERIGKLVRTALELALEWRQGDHCKFVFPGDVYAKLRADAVRLGFVRDVLEPQAEAKGESIRPA